MNNILKYVKEPYRILLFLDRRNLIKLHDDFYLKLEYKSIFGKKLNLDNPQTFNEKLNWLKLNDRKKIYTTMVDKYESKKYVADIIGEEYIIPTIGVYEKFKDINFDELPNQFVLKCTHDSGSTIVCKNKSEFNYELSKKMINKALKNNFYNINREWPYKNVKPQIIIEKYMEDQTGDLTDYKFYSFNGKCDYVMTCTDRAKGKTKYIYFDKEWKIQKKLSNDGMKYGDDIKIEKPVTLDKMFEFASILSKNIPFVRVDFYEVNGKLYFGELTFYPNAGFDNKRTKKIEEYLNNNLIIRGGKNK